MQPPSEPRSAAYSGQWWDNLIVHVCNVLLHLTTRRYRWTLDAVIRRGMSKDPEASATVVAESPTEGDT